MLVTMTFSIELLLCVVAGLAAGFAIFFQTSHFFQDNDVDDEAHHVTSNPCCEFMAEESREYVASEDDASGGDVLANPAGSNVRRRQLGGDEDTSDLTQPLVQPQHNEV